MKTKKFALTSCRLVCILIAAVCLLGLFGTPSAAQADDDESATTTASDADKSAKADSESKEAEKRRREKIRKLREELKKLEALDQPDAGGSYTPSGAGTSVAPAGQVPIEGTPAPTMPVAPTAQSGMSGGTGPGSMLTPTEQSLMPPTAYGPQDGFQRGSTGASAGVQPLGAPGMSPTGGAAPGMGPGGGGMGMNPLAPPTSNPQASGGAANMDPSFGRYASFAVPQAMGQVGAGKPQSVQAATREKPFANYTPPRAISPYQNLYREPMSGVDNYNAFVKPIMEQQRLNVQTQYEVSKLQRTSRAQGRNLQMLDRRLNPYQRELARPTTQQGPSQFMNLQQYYPGFGRR